MLKTDEGVWYAASDVLNWLSCAHRTTLDGQALDDPALREWLKAHKVPEDLGSDFEGAPKFSTPAQYRGDLHERAMLQRLVGEGRSIVEIPSPQHTAESIRTAAEATRRAMQQGVDVIFQATLLHAPWYGFADFLVRVDGTSELGEYAYEVRDTKLARHATSNALVQMAHYGLIVEQWQGVEPPSLRVWLGSGDEVEWAFRDAAPYLLEAQARYVRVREERPVTEPEPSSACTLCKWAEYCAEQWGPQDLTNVHRLTRLQRRVLREQGIATMPALAAATIAPDGMAMQTFERLRDQAVVQCGDEPFRVIKPQSASEGLLKVPVPHPGDLYFDLEGDPFAAVPTLDYLWAYCDVNGTYSHRWAHDTAAERDAFLWFLDTLESKNSVGAVGDTALQNADADWHVYHYNSYELTSLRRIAKYWPDEDEREQLLARVEDLIAQRFIDLYFIVDNSLRTQQGTTSLKLIEKLAGYHRTIDAAAVGKADESIKAYEQFIMSGDDTQKSEILQGILEYNTHDVRATHAVHRWLHGLAGTLAPEDAVADEAAVYAPSENVLERIHRTDELREELLGAAMGGPLPSGLSAHGATMLADMLGWHRREMVVQFQDGLRLQGWVRDGGHADDDVLIDDLLRLDSAEPRAESHIPRGTEHESCLLDYQLLGAQPVPGRRVLRHEFACRTGSWKVKTGDRVLEVLPFDNSRKPRSFSLADCDPAAGTFAIEAKDVPTEAIGFVKSETFIDEMIWESLMALGKSALLEDPPRHHVTGFLALDTVPPLAESDMARQHGDNASKRAQRICDLLTHGVLPVQGPAGTGKTWLAARLIADQLRRDANSLIFVTANSHRVIDNLMRGAAEHLVEQGISADFVRVGTADKVDDGYGAERIERGSDLVGWLDAQEPRALVIGATRYALCLPALADRGHMLFIDEAGQFTLADSLAVLHVAPVVVALGDPQQLSATVKAAHEEAVKVSLLEHLAVGEPVIYDSRGVFLDVSYRMHPAVCDAVARLSYNGELRSSEEAAARNIGGDSITLGSTTLPIEPGVHWVPVSGGVDAECGAVVAIIDALRAGATVTTAKGVTALTDDEILVVAPHNATVNRLRQMLLASIRVGTVDKFQGQEGHVVIFAMGRVAESAGDVPFLYELNRINVALSRARLMSVVVTAPDAVFPPVAAPDHLRLASRFITAIRP